MLLTNVAREFSYLVISRYYIQQSNVTIKQTLRLSQQVHFSKTNLHDFKLIQLIIRAK